MSDYTPIYCGLHDHIEIACLYRYRLRIGTTDATIVTGTAHTTETDTEKQEWLILAGEDGATSRIRLDRIGSMETLTPGAKFSKVSFR
jgi:Rho-binding antiterminator